jgi:RNA polymerase sigma-70 factor (ECF subfamily)
MKGNAMVLNLDNIVPFPGKTGAAAAERTAETNDQELFLHHLLPVKKHLYNFIRKSLNFSPETDDIFQDTLLKGYRYFYSFKREGNFKTWIFTIAHNLVKDHFKRSSAPVLLANADGLIIEEDTSILRDVREIYHVAGTLKPRQREVFFLYYYNGFNISEITAITGLTGVNIKFILYQARKAVKDIMGEEK